MPRRKKWFWILGGLLQDHTRTSRKVLLFLKAGFLVNGSGDCYIVQKKSWQLWAPCLQVSAGSL